MTPRRRIRHRPAAPRTVRADALLTAGVLLGLIAALLPVTRVVAPGAWLWGAIGLPAAILLTGYLLRRTRLPSAGVTAAEFALAIGVVAFAFLRDTAFLGVVASVQEAVGLTAAAADQIVDGFAPLPPTPEVSFVLVAAAAVVTIAIDHIALTSRMPLLAGVALFTVSLIPTLAVPSAMNMWSFVLLAVAILLLLRAETRGREPYTGRASGASAVAAGIGTVAIVTALVITPALPHPGGRSAPGTGARGIDASLALGEDLRRPDEIEVFRMRSTSPQPPYLRVATLSGFDGAVWEPDLTRSLPLESAAAFGGVQTDAGIAVRDDDTSIEITELSSSWLPVPFPAVSVDGLTGSWEALPLNRTVVGDNGATTGQSYVVHTRTPEPTLEQIRAARADASAVRDTASELPADVPPIIAQTARKVTAGTDNDYDALVAMQSWFRGADFRYSLDAPVEEGFDGSGADAVAAFLDAKAGYCVHYASAFALMARTLGMPARIVVGYLPGVTTSTVIDGETVRSVLSSQLHAWPEVFFDGIGWVPFEPTNSLGTATRFRSADDDSVRNTPSPAPTAAQTRSPSPQPTTSSHSLDADRADAAGAPAQRNTAILGWAGGALGILLLVSSPAILAEVRRRRLAAAAARGDAAAAWMLVQDAAQDLGIPASSSDSPRALGERLVQEHGAPAESMGALVAAIEESSYAPAGGRPDTATRTDARLDAAAREVRIQLALAATPRQRTVALLAPRSLLYRWLLSRRAGGR